MVLFHIGDTFLLSVGTLLIVVHYWVIKPYASSIIELIFLNQEESGRKRRSSKNNSKTLEKKRSTFFALRVL